jgi:hypothetical protein
MSDPAPVDGGGTPSASPRPVFVLGRHRSGTTWLANVIASFPGVYAVTHAAHRGVHESAYFSHLVPYCNRGRSRADLLEIKRLFERSDYFRLTGLASGPDILATGYARYFGLVMEEAARRHGASFWLEKTPAHTLCARYLARAFPGAIFIGVLRPTLDVVASNVHGFGDPRSVRAWFRQAAVTAVCRRIVGRSGATVVRFEELRDDFDATVARLAAILGVRPAVIAHEGFERNTSFAGEAPAAALWQRTAVALGAGLIRIVPGPLLDRALDYWVARRTCRSLPDWFFLLGARGADRPAVGEPRP